MLPSDWPPCVGCRPGLDLLVWMLPSTLDNTLFFEDLRRWSVGEAGSTMDGGDPRSAVFTGELRGHVRLSEPASLSEQVGC